MMPLIGITCSFGVINNNNLSSVNTSHIPQELNQLSDAYIKAIENAGGIPVIIPIISEQKVLYKLLDSLDGIVLSGGSDIDSHYYNERPTQHMGSITPQRDKQELEIINYLLDNNKPILGICRGMQMLNIALGGTLHQDLKANGLQCHILKMYPRDMPSHNVNIKQDSFMGECFLSEKIDVNSFHHQGICKLGNNLIATAISEDNLIEAIEYSNKEKAIIGVQWHPEAMNKDKNQTEIFKKFVESCSKTTMLKMCEMNG